MQALDALRSRPAAAIEDQFVHADRRETANAAGGVFGAPEKGRRDPSGNGMPVS
ncbi:MAG TPA: hypothetical protein VJ770_07865 [Stellaceae bacterium]|nr:hypothetical protein [Stellaceae bacterium]